MMDDEAEPEDDTVPRQPQVANWDLDSDEIASVTSEDLHAHRPNRWKGPKSTWRTLTGEERNLWRSMRLLEDQDLGLHLYNAFALKRRGRDPATAAEVTVQTDNGRQSVWAPPTLWTAWPLKESQVPQEGLFKTENDPDEPLTFRKKETKAPSSDLQDEVTAAILRLAKERFRRRKGRAVPLQQSIEDAASDENMSLPSSPPVASSSGNEDGESDAESPGDTFEPGVATDDAASGTLLRPSVRHILTQLDRTLTVLHNARVAGFIYLSDSDSSTEDDSDTGTPRRKRGRPRRTPQPGEDAQSSRDATPSGPGRRGRPRKVHTPRAGETQEDMEVRVARESHRRLPFTDADRDAAFETWVRKGDARLAPPRSPDADAKADAGTRHSKLNRWGLRDWSDVVGAAALAGFPDAVVARTAQRCASLFSEAMTLRRLGEAPASRGPAFSSKEYRPAKIAVSDIASSDDETQTLQQRRIASRQASLARSHTPPRGRQSHSTQSQSRSRSRSSGLLFCPVSECDRAANGFSRRSNLKRHMQLLHPGYEVDEADSDDQVVGAVSIDGFLRPIQPTRGWRGEDVYERKRKRLYGRDSD